MLFELFSVLLDMCLCVHSCEYIRTCVCMCLCVFCVCVCTSACTQMTEKGTSPVPLWQQSQVTLLSLLTTKLGFQVFTGTARFLCGYWDLNSGPHDWWKSALKYWSTSQDPLSFCSLSSILCLIPCFFIVQVFWTL